MNNFACSSWSWQTRSKPSPIISFKNERALIPLHARTLHSFVDRTSKHNWSQTFPGDHYIHEWSIFVLDSQGRASGSLHFATSSRWMHEHIWTRPILRIPETWHKTVLAYECTILIPVKSNFPHNAVIPQGNTKSRGQSKYLQPRWILDHQSKAVNALHYRNMGNAFL